VSHHNLIPTVSVFCINQSCVSAPVLTGWQGDSVVRTSVFFLRTFPDLYYAWYMVDMWPLRG